MDENGQNDLHKRTSLLAWLSASIERWTAEQEDVAMAFPGLSVFRRNIVSEACPCLYDAGMVCVTQGAKQMQLGEQVYRYDESQFLITPVALPASTQVMAASAQTPCLGFSLQLDRSIITEMFAQMPHCSVGQAVPHERSYAATGCFTDRFLELMVRLFVLCDEPEHHSVMVPLLQRELHYRLLVSDVAPVVHRMALTGRAYGKLFDAVQWLRKNYSEPLKIKTLAERVYMSPSSLHDYFRHMTGHSPLQYQKWLRLNEARRLMLNNKISATSVAYQVGYESPSHFSRDYKRFFGLSPKREIENFLGSVRS